MNNSYCWWLWFSNTIFSVRNFSGFTIMNLIWIKIDYQRTACVKPCFAHCVLQSFCVIITRIEIYDALRQRNEKKKCMKEKNSPSETRETVIKGIFCVSQVRQPYAWHEIPDAIQDGFNSVSLILSHTKYSKIRLSDAHYLIFVGDLQRWLLWHWSLLGPQLQVNRPGSPVDHALEHLAGTEPV